MALLRKQSRDSLLVLPNDDLKSAFHAYSAILDSYVYAYYNAIVDSLFFDEKHCILQYKFVLV